MLKKRVLSLGLKAREEEEGNKKVVRAMVNGKRNWVRKNEHDNRR